MKPCTSILTEEAECWAFSSSRRNWDSPNPSPAGAGPPPPGSGEWAHSLAREGVGESQFRRGDRHCGSLYVLCVYSHHLFIFFRVTNKRCWQPPPPLPPLSLPNWYFFHPLEFSLLISFWHFLHPVEFSFSISFCFHCVIIVATVFSISNWIRFQKKFLLNFYLAEVQVLVYIFFSSISMF